MRYRTARLIRLVVIVALLILVTQFFLSNHQLTNEQTNVDNKEELNSNSKNARSLIKASKLEPIMSGSDGNYEPKKLSKRKGPGEGGVPVTLAEDEEAAAQKTISKYGFNMLVSDQISLDRQIRDTRPDECKRWIYPKTKYLPTASVIIVFYNEGRTVLLRTIHSVINTSPKELLEDIILVDDGSTDAALLKPLEKYIKRFNGLVKLYRTGTRLGLIAARMLGARKAKGEVIVIVDAHCECVVNWLPPLLTRIALNRKALAIPIVDGLNWNTFEHTDTYGSAKFRGIWEWGFLYKETGVPEQELSKRTFSTEPYWSPTHAGGLLAIDRQWFFELGGYDPGIKVWGAEQYELSFKVWQCGGVVEWVPCSHIAHAYRGPRTSAGQHVENTSSYQTYINHMRVAAVWMDEYSQYYEIREPAISKLNYGDITERQKIREKLQCKSFKWFMENIAYDVLQKFPPPPKNVVWGQCKNVKHDVCLHDSGVSFGQPIGISSCSGHQVWRLNEGGEMAVGEHCFVSDHHNVKKKFCLDHRGHWNPTGEWQYDMSTQQIRSNKHKLCMETDGQAVKLAECDENNDSQKWKWKKFYY